MFQIPHAEAWGGSTWRRIRREARRVRDQIRRNLEHARQEAERQLKQTAAHVREGDLRINLDRLEQQALTYLSTATAATPFLPASQIVQLSIAALQYEGVVREMEVLEMDSAERDRAQQRSDRSEQTLQRLEQVRVDSGVRVGFLPPPAEDVQSAEMARVQKAQLGEYMAILVLEAAFYQNIHGEVPNRRPVTLIYKIGQALIDYAQLKQDVLLISQTQPTHAALYDDLITNGHIESVATLLTRALTFLETMPVANRPDPPISVTSRVGRHLTTADRLERSAEQIIADHTRFPLLEAPVQAITDLNAAIGEITHDRRNSSTAWILLLPQHEIDALDAARVRLTRKSDALTALHIPTPQELVGRFLFESLFVLTRYQQLGTRGGVEAVVLHLEVRELKEKLQFSIDLVTSQRLPFPSNLMSTVRQALQALMNAEADLATRASVFLQSSSSSAASVTSVSSESASSASSTSVLSTSSAPSISSAASSAPSSTKPSVISSSRPQSKRERASSKSSEEERKNAIREERRMRKQSPAAATSSLPSSSSSENSVSSKEKTRVTSPRSSKMFSKASIRSATELSSKSDSSVPSLKFLPDVFKDGGSSSASAASSSVATGKAVSSAASVSSASTGEKAPLSSAQSSTLPIPAPRVTLPVPSASGEIVVTTAKIDLYGVVDNRTVKLLVNGEPASNYTPTAGKFWIALSLIPGKNFVEIVSVDAQGTRSPTLTLTIVYSAPTIRSLLPSDDAWIKR